MTKTSSRSSHLRSWNRQMLLTEMINRLSKTHRDKYWYRVWYCIKHMKSRPLHPAHRRSGVLQVRLWRKRVDWRPATRTSSLWGHREVSWLCSTCRRLSCSEAGRDTTGERWASHAELFVTIYPKGAMSAGVRRICNVKNDWKCIEYQEFIY